MSKRLGLVGAVLFLFAGTIAVAAPTPIDPKVDAARRASLAQMQLVRPAIRPVATPAQMNAVATQQASKYPKPNTSAIGAPAVRFTTLPTRKYLPPGVKLPITVGQSSGGLQILGTPTYLSTAVALPASAPPPASCNTCGAGVAVQTLEPITAITAVSANPDLTTTGVQCVPVVGNPNNGNCSPIHVGDTLTIIGSGFSKLAQQQAHLFFWNAQQDYLANVIVWTDTVVMIQVPTNLQGLAYQHGILSLGGPNCACETTMWTFDWQPVMTTAYLPFVINQYPPGTIIRTGTYSPLPTTMSTVGAGINPTTWSSSYGPGLGDSQNDTFFPPTPTGQPGFQLRNGWTTTGVAPFSVTPGPGNASVSGLASGSTSPTMQVSWNYALGSYVNYQLSIQVQGEAGTSPTCTTFDGNGNCLN